MADEKDAQIERSTRNGSSGSKEALQEIRDTGKVNERRHVNKRRRPT